MKIIEYELMKQKMIYIDVQYGAIQNKKRNQRRKPSKILQNGMLTYLGSGGNHEYVFEKSEYKYVLSVNILGYDDSLGDLEIYKNNELIKEEKFFKNDDKTKSKFDRKYKTSKLTDVIIENLKETWKDFDVESKDPFDMKQKEKENLDKLRKGKKNR